MSKNNMFEDNFKIKIVELYNNGKSAKDLSKEYSIGYSTLYAWVKKYNNTGSFKAKDNRTDEENKLIKLEKELKQLRMENDILKQAALIMGRK